jgi:hypothetical protein
MIEHCLNFIKKLRKIRKKSAVPEYIWFISLVVIAITLVISLKSIFSNASNVAKNIQINDVNAEIKIHRDYLGGLWLEKLKFKVPKGVNEKEFINNLKLVCFDDKKGPLIINLTELNTKFLSKDISNYYTLTIPIHLSGPDDTTVLYYSFDDCINGNNITKDLSGNNNHGIIYGNPKCVKGIKGYALEFDNTSQYIESKYANNVNNETISYCTWVNMNNFIYENQFLYIKAINTGGSLRFFYFSSWCGDGSPHNCTHGGVINTDGTWGRAYGTQRIFNLNKWYFICQVVDTNRGFIQYWNNGKLIINKTIPTGDIPGKPTNIWIAGSPEGYQHLTGINDESILFNKALKPYEIKTMYYFNCSNEGAKWFLFLGDPREDGIKLASTEVN